MVVGNRMTETLSAPHHDLLHWTWFISESYLTSPREGKEGGAICQTSKCNEISFSASTIILSIALSVGQEGPTPAHETPFKQKFIISRYSFISSTNYQTQTRAIIAASYQQLTTIFNHWQCRGSQKILNDLGSQIWLMRKTIFRESMSCFVCVKNISQTKPG